jgi:hypothetical protein
MKRFSVLAVGVFTAAGLVVAGGTTAASAHKPPMTTVTSVSPQHGPTAGGTIVVIHGKNLVGATAVDFGSTPAATFTPKGNEIVATSPGPEAVSAVDVRVTTSLGTSAPNPPHDQFSFVSGPTIQSVFPRAGSDTGGTKVTIAGTDFSAATEVEFGNVSIPFTIRSSQAITLVTPGPEPVGTVPVSVATPDGTTPADPVATFTYASRVPVVRLIEPPSGPVGQQVTISGSRFVKKGTTVDFNLTPATSVTVENSRTITADAPAGSGTVDITVTDAKGTSSTSSADEFTYTAT